MNERLPIVEVCETASQVRVFPWQRLRFQILEITTRRRAWSSMRRNIRATSCSAVRRSSRLASTKVNECVLLSFKQVSDVFIPYLKW